MMTALALFLSLHFAPAPAAQPAAPKACWQVAVDTRKPPFVARTLCRP